MVLMRLIGHVKNLPLPTPSMKMMRVIPPAPMDLVQLIEKIIEIIISLEHFFPFSEESETLRLTL